MASSINVLTVRTPLKPVTSTWAPTSCSENFSNKLLINGILANIWKYLFNAKLVNARPNFLVTALEKEMISIYFIEENELDIYISGISGSLAKSFCLWTKSFSSIFSSSSCTSCAVWCWANIGLSFFGS